MWSRSEAAFRFSAQRLFELYPRVYFWTFTSARVNPDWWYGEIWSRFSRDLSNLYGGTLHGLKVLELHKEHGLHFHGLLNERVYAGEVWRIARRYGLGWNSVKRADTGSIDYLAKYLTKQWKTEHIMFAKAARWGTIGGFRATRCKDVIIDSVYHRAVKICQEALGEKKLPFLLCKAIQAKATEDPAELQAAMKRWQESGSISNLWGGRLPPSRVAVTNHLAALAQ